MKVHFKNEKQWSTVYAKFGSGSNWSQITGCEQYNGTDEHGAIINPDTDNDGWYAYEVTLPEDVTVVNGLFNNGDWGTENQTGNYQIPISGDMEVWITYTGSSNNVQVLNEKPADKTEEDESYTPSSKMYVSDRVQLVVDDQTYEMDLYNKGVYEVGVDLTKGEHTAKALVNGEEAGDPVDAELSEDGKVYFRVQNNELSQVTKRTEAYLEGNFGTGDGQLALKGADGKELLNWQADKSANDLSSAKLTYIGGGLYKGTFTFDKLQTAQKIEFKVAFDGTWDDSIGNGSDNLSFEIPEGRDSITIVCDSANNVIYDDVRTGNFEFYQSPGENKANGSGHIFSAPISIIGTIRNGEDEWAVDSKAEKWAFRPISDTLYLYQTILSGNCQYKCVFDYSKWYEMSSDNITLNISTADTPVIILYDTTTGELYDSINDDDTVAKKLGMALVPKEPKVEDNPDGTVSFQAVGTPGQKATLYYAANGKDPKFTEIALKESKSGVYNSSALSLGEEALDLLYYYQIGDERIPSAKEENVVEVNGSYYYHFTRDAYQGRDVYVPGTFPGPSWDPASNKMTYKGNSLYEYTFKNVPAANYEFKIAMGSWDECYGINATMGGTDNNYSVAVPSQQDITIYYHDKTHLAVTSLNYVFADVALSGKGIPEGTKLVDPGLTGFYSAQVTLQPGTYSDVTLTSKEGSETVTKKFDSFTIEEAKDVTFYYAPEYGVFYHDAAVWNDKVSVKFDSKDENYKSVFGAVATGEKVTFALEAGTDVTGAALMVKQNGVQSFDMKKSGDAKDGVQKWTVTASFDTIGEYQYFFAVYQGNAVKIYSDDDGYYGVGKLCDLSDMKPYDLVVYRSGYKTPDWMKNAVIYQIFPDRFFDGDTSNNRAQFNARGATNYEYIEDWYTIPENPEQEALIGVKDGITKEQYTSTGAFFGDGEWSNEIYGGDFQGIIKKIDYLKALGVNVIYLNPSFASISSHRYDTSDYEIIDPILGDLGDFTELVQVAEENDMHIILDGVFNHVSDDSKYFDRYYKYLQAGTDKIGAYPYWAYVYDYMADNKVEQAQAEEAARKYFTKEYGITDYSYTTWFEVFNKPMGDGTVTDKIGLRAEKPVYNYDGWWGYDSMPIIKSTNGSEYQTTDWADEIIDGDGCVTQYWISQGSNGWRLDVANEVSDETWQRFRESVKGLDSDAVIIGEIWTDATKYLLGDMYDSVMNYMFRNAVTDFAMKGNAEEAMNSLERLRERYPKEAFYAMMNLVDSHDTTRILSYLDGIGDDRNQKDLASAFPTYNNTSDEAKAKQYLVAFLQFTYAGAPTIYYGDEIGMVGADDPDDRRAFEWGKGNQKLVEWYAKLAAVRSEYSALRTGSVEPIDTNNNSVLGFVRRDSKDTLIVLANSAADAQSITLNLSDLNVTAADLKDLLGTSSYTVAGGSVTVSVPARNGVILIDSTKAKDVSINAADLKPAYDNSTENIISSADREPEPGNVEIGESQNHDGLTAELGADIQTFINMGKITQEELDNVEEGMDLSVYLSVRDYEAFVTEEEVAKLQEALKTAKADGFTLGSYLDLDLLKRAGMITSPITELSDKIQVTISVPSALLKDGREYKIIRMHNGEAEVLDSTFNAAKGTITFMTDKFSLYAIAYKDSEAVSNPAPKPEQESTKKPDTAPTGDNSPIIPLAALLFASALVVGVTAVRRKKAK